MLTQRVCRAQLPCAFGHNQNCWSSTHCASHNALIKSVHENVNRSGQCRRQWKKERKNGKTECRDTHMLRAKIKTKDQSEPVDARTMDTKQNETKQHRERRTDQETKQGKNMIQIIVLNIAKCNYQQQHTNTWACAYSMPVQSQRQMQRLLEQSMQRSAQHFHLFLFLSFVVGAATLPCVFFIFRKSGFLCGVHPIWHTPFDLFLMAQTK